MPVRNLEVANAPNHHQAITRPKREAHEWGSIVLNTSNDIHAMIVDMDNGRVGWRYNRYRISDAGLFRPYADTE
jgi:hypothetical protein